MNRNRADLDLKDIHQQSQEALILYSTVLAWRPNRIFEVGSFKGGSGKIIAQALVDSGNEVSPRHLFMIDPDPRLTPENAEFLQDKATIIAAPSPAAYQQLPDPNDGFDMAFIDGDHAEDAVYADLMHAHRLLRPGAIVLCHDSYYMPTRRGILRAAHAASYIDCGEMVRDPVTTEQFENGYRVEWGGLRMLRKSF